MISFAEIDVVALIQCTSPFLKASFLAEAYSKMMDGGYDCVFSVTREYKLRWKELPGTVFSNLLKTFASFSSRRMLLHVHIALYMCVL
jgi:CMP-N-acetylneuraminic acid synthetase